MSENKFLETADAIGARLCRDALWAGDRCNWLGDAMEYAESRWQVVHRSFGPDLYSGTSGIAVFLGRLFASTQEKIFKATAEGAIRCAISQMHQLNPSQDFGFYSGLTGIAFALSELAEVLENEQLHTQGLEILRGLPVKDIAFQSWDVISGSAGIIPVLLKMHGRYKHDFLLDAASRHGEMLLGAANRSDQSWSWKTIGVPGQKDLTGFSHGTAGIAWSLLELNEHVKEPRFFDAANAALHYERRCYDPQQENWPDFRAESQNGKPICAVAWCHGAPGIGLSRLRAYQILKDSDCRKEADAAIKTTTRALTAALQTGEGNYSLCHGNLGNCELLLHACDVLGDSSGMETVVSLANEGIHRFEQSRNSWPCGVLNGGESPNLMLGLAGIGYFYLRLHDRKKSPSLLMISPN